MAEDLVYRGGIAVTPHDTNAIPATKGLYVGGAGNIACRFRDGSADVTLTGVPVGTVLRVAVTNVRSTSTTATNIVALY
jgi:hypothetical protein